jgi:hypothetical protein
MRPVGIGTKSNCAGKSQQQLAVSSGTAGKGTLAVRNRYQERLMKSEKTFMCGVLAVVFGVWKSVRLP